jgi:hypothetical protein
MPELETTNLLDHKKSTFYQSQIGVLHWMVELGWINIITEVSELSTFLAMPREVHLEAVFHIFNYLEKRHNSFTHDNPANICTKVIPGGQKQDHLVGLLVDNVTDYT